MILKMIPFVKPNSIVKKTINKFGEIEPVVQKGDLCACGQIRPEKGMCKNCGACY